MQDLRPVSDVREVPILFVDDDPFMHKLFQTMLTEYNVKYTFSADEALEVLSSENIMLVITDISMPGMDGIELLRRIKKTYGAIQTIIITANLEVDYLVSALEAGANDFLLKPVDRDTVQQAIKATVVKINRWKTVMKELFAKRRNKLRGDRQPSE